MKIHNKRAPRTPFRLNNHWLWLSISHFLLTPSQIKNNRERSYNFDDSWLETLGIMVIHCDPSKKRLSRQPVGYVRPSDARKTFNSHNKNALFSQWRAGMDRSGRIKFVVIWPVSTQVGGLGTLNSNFLRTKLTSTLIYRLCTRLNHTLGSWRTGFMKYFPSQSLTIE